MLPKASKPLTAIRYSVVSLLLLLSKLHAQIIINGTHTITVSNSQTININEAISGDSNSTLNIFGHGRVDLHTQSNDYWGKVVIRGAEFRTTRTGTMVNPRSITVENGGVFIMDNNGGSEVNHLSESSEIILAGGTVRMIGRSTGGSGNSGEDFGSLIFSRGANIIDIQNINSGVHTDLTPVTGFHRKGLSTLNLIGNVDYAASNQANRVSFRSKNWSAEGGLDRGGVIAWATVEGKDWATRVEVGATNFLLPYTSYWTGAQDTWITADNVQLLSSEVLTDNRRINSLKIGSIYLNIGKYTLDIDSGGLLSIGSYTRISGTGTITVGAPNRPLYAHVYSDKLILEGETAFSGDFDLVKTGPGSLELDSDATHKLGAITIHQGALRLLKGSLSVSDDIVVGDGSGQDLFELAAQSDNRIIKTGGRIPSMTLHGNPHGPATDEAILRFNGNSRQGLTALTIQDRGTIDFIGANKSAPNILYLDQLHFSDTNAQLIIRNWDDQADYLLVKRNWGNTNVPPILSQIYFEGYGPAKWHWHDLGSSYDGYWQITPLPEPTTYGVILGAVGLTLVVWRKRRRSGKTKGSVQNPDWVRTQGV